MSTASRSSSNLLFQRCLSVLGFVLPDILMRGSFVPNSYEVYLTIKGCFYFVLNPINDFYQRRLLTQYLITPREVFGIVLWVFGIWTLVLLPLVTLLVTFGPFFPETRLESVPLFLASWYFNGFMHFLLHIINDWTFPKFTANMVFISLLVQKTISSGVLYLVLLDPETLETFLLTWALSTSVYVLLKLLFTWIFFYRIEDFYWTHMGEEQVTPAERGVTYGTRFLGVLSTLPLLLYGVSDPWIIKSACKGTPSSEEFHQVLENTKLPEIGHAASLQLFTILGMTWRYGSLLEVTLLESAILLGVLGISTGVLLLSSKIPPEVVGTLLWYVPLKASVIHFMRLNYLRTPESSRTLLLPCLLVIVYLATRGSLRFPETTQYLSGPHLILVNYLLVHGTLFGFNLMGILRAVAPRTYRASLQSG